MPTTRLFLVRHGETTVGTEDRFAGSSDVPLGPSGRTQAEKLAVRLATERIAAAYSSPMSRTIDTASSSRGRTAWSRRCGTAREIGHGHWEASAGSRSRKNSATSARRGWRIRSPSPRRGESGVQVAARALPVIRDIVVRHPGEHVLVVSHKATIRLIIASLLGFDPRGYRDRLDQQPACLNVLDFLTPVRARLVLFNDVSHYAVAPPPLGRRLSKWCDPTEPAREM
jgi:probable phosphoglycerate mutase